MFKRLINHYRRWKAWSKVNTNSWFHKILVLLGLRHSPSMELFFLPEEWEDLKDKFYFKKEKCGDTYVRFVDDHE